MSDAKGEEGAHSVLVAAFATDAEAHLAADGLRSAGIDATAIPASAIGIAGGAQESYARLLVSSESATDARAFIGAPPGTSAAPISMPTQLAAPRRLVTALLVAVLLVVTVVLGLRVISMERTIRDLVTSAYDDPYYEGNCQIFPWRGTDIKGTAYCDEDRATGYDVTFAYSSTGRLLSKSIDPDQTGSVQEYVGFDIHGVPTVRSYDKDQDGAAELEVMYDRGGNETVRLLDEDQDGRIEKWIEKKGYHTEVWIDSSGDGSPDRMERRDASGSVIQSLVEAPDGWVVERPASAGEARRNPSEQ